jgi:uncharacterized protein YecT (DUF1311 family)
MNLRPLLIGACAALACSAALAQGSSEFAAADARLKACIARDSSNDGIQTCASVVQKIADARLNAVYGNWTDALKHPGPSDAKDDAEILKRLVTAERAWMDLRDKGLRAAEHLCAWRNGRDHGLQRLPLQSNEGSCVSLGSGPRSPLTGRPHVRRGFGPWAGAVTHRCTLPRPWQASGCGRDEQVCLQPITAEHRVRSGATDPVRKGRAPAPCCAPRCMDRPPSQAE